MNEHTVRQIAEVCHEVNRAYCVGIGDTSQPTWEDAPEWQKLSAIDGVYFHLNNPDAAPSASHENWLKAKVDAGWVYGPLKNPEATPPTHPCILPYDKLPVHQRVKDFLFIGVVHSMSKIYS